MFIPVAGSNSFCAIERMARLGGVASDMILRVVPLNGPPTSLSQFCTSLGPPPNRAPPPCCSPPPQDARSVGPKLAVIPRYPRRLRNSRRLRRPRRNSPQRLAMAFFSSASRDVPATKTLPPSGFHPPLFKGRQSFQEASSPSVDKSSRRPLRFLYSRSPPRVSPRTRWRWTKRIKRRVGIIAVLPSAAR